MRNLEEDSEGYTGVGKGNYDTHVKYRTAGKFWDKKIIAESYDPKFNIDFGIQRKEDFPSESAPPQSAISEAMQKTTSKTEVTRLGKGERGCALSHHTLWKEVTESEELGDNKEIVAR